MATRPLFACVLVSAAASLASAAIRYELPQVKALTDGTTPTTGAFDVLVRVDVADLPRQVSSFNVDLHASSTSVVLGPPQAPPAPLLAGAPSNFSPNPQTVRAARDVFPTSVPLVDAGQLIRVGYSIPAGVAGVFSLAFGQFNQLADSQALSLPIATTDVGSISIFYSADFTEDGKVSAADVAAFAIGLGLSSGALHSQGDATGDGVVDGVDFLVLQRQLGTGGAAVAAAATVPEPTGAAALAVAGLWHACVGRRARVSPSRRVRQLA